jgi:hypothetical protein
MIGALAMAAETEQPRGQGAAMTPDMAGTPLRGAAAAGLDARLLAAHASGDRDALVELYARAAGDADGIARAFYLTHAYVFALEAGDPRAAGLKARLVALGADTA